MSEQAPRTILITGATRGLGRALLERYAAEGHRLIGCGRDPQKAAALQDTLGEPHLFSTLDVADDDAVARWAELVVARFGAPDLLVNNAALINQRAPLWQVPVAEFDGVIDVNIKGVVNVIRHFVPAMIARGHGVVCNISSGWGKFTAPDVAPYCATKFAIEGLTGAMAQELPPGLAAIALSPGIIHTDMLDVAFGPEAEAHWRAADWVEVAAPFILRLGPTDNGKSLRVPGSLFE